MVAECGADCVSVFSPGGEKLRSFGTYGSPWSRTAVDSTWGIISSTADKSESILTGESDTQWCGSTHQHKTRDRSSHISILVDTLASHIAMNDLYMWL